jgi:hypothetical protein
MGYKQVNKGYTMAMASLSDYQMFWNWTHCVGTEAELVTVPKLLPMFLCHEHICGHRTVIWDSIDYR